MEEDKKIEFEKYRKVDSEKNAIELDMYQLAVLNKFLNGTSFRFNSEDIASKGIQRIIRELDKPESKSKGKMQSSYAESDDMSSKKESTSNKKQASSSSIKSKTAPNEEMKKCLSSLEKAKQSTSKILPNILNEIDFDSLLNGIRRKQLSSSAEYEATAKQIFSIVMRKYEKTPSVVNLLNSILNV